MFSQETDETVITLIKLKQNTKIGMAQDIRIADNYTQRISETANHIQYGVISNSETYNFIPLELVLPNEDQANAPRCTITVHDLTRALTPTIRSLTGPVDVDLSLVLASTPNVVEILYTGLQLTNISYNASSISADLTMPSLEIEPFPMHAFTPAYFPGLF